MAEAGSLIDAETTSSKVSSTLNKDTRQFGKKYLFDGLEETCWNSDQVMGAGVGCGCGRAAARAVAVAGCVAVVRDDCAIACHAIWLPVVQHNAAALPNPLFIVNGTFLVLRSYHRRS